jgi:hypothetical protein
MPYVQQKPVAAAPDVCTTPSPAGPVPMPYPNTAGVAEAVAMESLLLETMTTGIGSAGGSASSAANAARTARTAQQATRLMHMLGGGEPD